MNTRIGGREKDGSSTQAFAERDKVSHEENSRLGMERARATWPTDATLARQESESPYVDDDASRKVVVSARITQRNEQPHVEFTSHHKPATLTVGATCSERDIQCWLTDITTKQCHVEDVNTKP